MNKKEIVFVDMDGVLANLEEKAKKTDPDFGTPRQKIDSRPYRKEGFYRDLKPIDGAIEGYKKLTEKYDCYILSAPSWRNPSSYSDKRLWVEEHLGEFANKRLVLSHNKGLFQGRALIDDRLTYGVKNFQGEHIHFGSEKFPNWKSILEYLKV